MLAFDYAPASFFNPESLLRSSQVREPSFFLDPPHPYHQQRHYRQPQQQPRRIVRSRSYQPRRPNQQDYLHALLNQLVDHEEEPSKPEVHSRVVNTKDSFQIQVYKDDDDFKHYSIRYKVLGRDIVIYVESKIDDFVKGFKFDQNVIDINNVQWKVFQNVLVVDIPKCRDEFIIRPSVRSIPKNLERRNESTPKPKQHSPKPTPNEKLIGKSSSEKLETSPKSTENAASKVISIPIEFVDSETEITPKSSRPNSRRSSISESSSKNNNNTPTKTNTRTESEAELSEDDETLRSPKLPKLKRRVSIEEVEDESLKMDLD